MSDGEAMFVGVAGAVIADGVGWWLAVRDSGDVTKAAAMARRVILVVGVLLVVGTVLPDYNRGRLGREGYYYWSEQTRVLLAVGVVLIVLAVLTKPRGKPF